MNLVDLAVLAIVAVSALLGLSRGLVRELLGLGAWLLAGYGAFVFGARLVPVAREAIGNQDLADPVAYVGTFLLLLIALSLAANVIGRLVRVSALGGLDRTLGLVFGIARGAVLLVAAYVPLGLMLPQDRWPPAVAQARTLPLVHAGALWAVERMPPAWRPRVAAPPDERQTTAAALLHATPEGSALGPRVGHN